MHMNLIGKAREAQRQKKQAERRRKKDERRQAKRARLPVNTV
jgi:hypothetical protein